MAVVSPTFTGRAILFDDVAVIGDLHVGKAHASNVDFPIGESDDLLARFEDLCSRAELAEVVIAGDLLHSFDNVPGRVTETLGALKAVADGNDVTVVVLPGNHDTLLDACWDGTTRSEYQIGDTVIVHGHVEPETPARRYVIGHEHPVIEIEGRRHACFLLGEGVYDGADLIVVPAFNRLLAGVVINDMRTADFMSPLVRNAGAMAPIVWDEQEARPLHFPPLEQFRHRL